MSVLFPRRARLHAAEGAGPSGCARSITIAHPSHQPETAVEFAHLAGTMHYSIPRIHARSYRPWVASLVIRGSAAHVRDDPWIAAADNLASEILAASSLSLKAKTSMPRSPIAPGAVEERKLRLLPHEHPSLMDMNFVAGMDRGAVAAWLERRRPLVHARVLYGCESATNPLQQLLSSSIGSLWLVAERSESCARIPALSAIAEDERHADQQRYDADCWRGDPLRGASRRACPRMMER